MAFQCCVVGMLQTHQFRRADIRREPDIVVAEVQRLTGRHRDPRRIQQLQQNVQHARMRLLGFVKQERPFRWRARALRPNNQLRQAAHRAADQVIPDFGIRSCRIGTIGPARKSGWSSQ